jgi:hypothetical protein
MSTRDSAPWGPKRNLSQQIGAVMPKAAGTVLEESSTQFRGRRQERLVCCTVAPDDKALKVVSGGHEDGKKIYDLVENVVKDTLPESSSPTLRTFASYGGLVDNNWKEIRMGKFIDAGCVPEDDPMFNGSWMIQSVRRSKPSTTSGQPENKSPEPPTKATGLSSPLRTKRPSV